ncbi:hypothetical protein V9T40_012121 [Parthenolecanium corni]|uniref:UV radiation resistance-associated gene protein n=1 Tax=Parthenolecanium corni TaxID=536013 RepID=A0AAN9Y053_9HEMI
MSTLMLQHSAVRWKEWLPLVTQQQRFRNLIQIIGYNIGLEEDRNTKYLEDISYYYTLHFSTMSAPFYTSEKISKEHPKWSEINFKDIQPSFGSAKGIVVRVWRHSANEDTAVTVWGVYFSGLSYIGPHILPQEGLTFAKNTLIFYMHGGYFTSTECLLNDEPMLARITVISLNQNDVRKSYTVESLSRLHSIQRSVKEGTEESVVLHNKILKGEFLQDKSLKEASPFLRKLMSRSKPTKVSHDQIMEVKKNIENKKFQVQLLQEQKSHKLLELKKRKAYRNSLTEKNKEEDLKIKNSHDTLQEDFEYIKSLKKNLIESKDDLVCFKSKYTYREKKLIAELAHIYPIESKDSKYTICGVHLPNSEDFVGVNETSLNVALGFTAHLVEMLSLIIDIPLRYPVIHLGSRSKIVDHIADKIPDKDREFPLFNRSKDKLQFNYAVYLLNKDVAQLRWYFGYNTTDLRATLPNLETLFNMHSMQKSDIRDNRFTSGSISKLSISRNSLQYGTLPSRFNLNKNEKLSYSLDRGLDQWNQRNEKDPSQNTSEPVGHCGGLSADSTDQDASESVNMKSVLSTVTQSTASDSQPSIDS